jgi:hypothetical protein
MMAEYVARFVGEQRRKWKEPDDGDFPRSLDGRFNGDGAREALCFGLMVENPPCGVYRVWSRAWLVSKLPAPLGAGSNKAPAETAGAPFATAGGIGCRSERSSTMRCAGSCSRAPTSNRFAIRLYARKTVSPRISSTRKITTKM